MKIKKYNPVKVIDPFSDGHAVRLQPCQSFQLVLSVSYGEVYEVDINSEYLVLEKIEYEHHNSTGTKREVYHISQKYNLAKWSVISNVFLGNVIINRKTADKSVGYQVCVYLNCSNENKNKVLTVINPNNNLVKIEPSTLVEIVIFGKDAGRWSLRSVEESGCFCVRSETVYNDICDVYDPDLTFCSEPRNVHLPVNSMLQDSKQCVMTQAANKSIDRPTKEYHFWIHLDARSLRKAATTTSGNYPIGEVKFSCKDDDDVAGKVINEHVMDLMLSLRRNDEKINASEYQALRSVAEKWSIRSINPTQNSVICPNFNESVDVSPNAEFLYIEIPQPSVYIGKEAEGFWSVDAGLESTKKISLQIEELTPRYVNGYMVQRFLMNNLKWSKPIATLLFMGHVNFSFNKFKRSPLIPYSSSYKGICISLWRNSSNEASKNKMSNLANDLAKENDNRIVSRSVASRYESGWYSGRQSSAAEYKHLPDEIEIVQVSVFDLENTFSNKVSLNSIVVKKKTQIACGYDFDDIYGIGDDEDDSKKKVSTTCSERQTCSANSTTIGFCRPEEKETQKTSEKTHKEEKEDDDWRRRNIDHADDDYDFTKIYCC